jgi:hypothetical protein
MSPAKLALAIAVATAAIPLLLANTAGTDSACTAGCAWTLTFNLATPIAGNTIVVETRAPAAATAATKRMECSRGDASLSCSYDPGFGLRAGRDSQDRVVAVTWENAPPGEVNLQVFAHGLPVVNKTVTFAARSEHQVCTQACQESAAFTVE